MKLGQNRTNRHQKGSRLAPSNSSQAVPEVKAVELLESLTHGGGNASVAESAEQPQQKQHREQPEQRQWQQYRDEYMDKYADAYQKYMRRGEDREDNRTDTHQRDQQTAASSPSHAVPELKPEELLASPALGGENASAIASAEQPQQKQH